MGQPVAAAYSGGRSQNPEDRSQKACQCASALPIFLVSGFWFPVSAASLSGAHHPALNENRCGGANPGN